MKILHFVNVVGLRDKRDVGTIDLIHLVGIPIKIMHKINQIIPNNMPLALVKDGMETIGLRHLQRAHFKL